MIIRFPPSAKLGQPMATYTKPEPGWYRLLHHIAEAVMFLLIVFTAMVVCYTIAPPVEDRPQRPSYLP